MIRIPIYASIILALVLPFIGYVNQTSPTISVIFTLLSISIIFIVYRIFK